MNPSQVYEFLLNTLQPSYEKEFGIERRKDYMNVSKLVSGTKSYLYDYHRKLQVDTPKLSFALLRGKSVHFYISSKLEDMDKHELRWKLPYDWKDGTKDITLIGHYDNVLPIENSVLAEFKSTAQDTPTKNGLLIRAKRQLATYTQILRSTTGVERESFIVIFNTERDFVSVPPSNDVVYSEPRCVVVKLTPDEIREGYEFVRKTAYEVARALDVGVTPQ